MGPRPMASRDDETAAAFLDAGSALIDAMLAADRSGPLPARLRQLHYPAPLEWIRIEDVLRIVGGSAQAGRKAFYNRWPTKDDYIRDCFIRVRNVAWGIAAPLLNDPRASLLSHAAVMVNHDPLTSQVVADAIVMSHRVGVSETARDNGALAGALGDALVAILGSAIDWEQDGATVDAWIEGRSATRLENIQL